ncbi:MAG: dihydropteroate synthase [Crocinitomicaceae bacterium]
MGIINATPDSFYAKSRQQKVSSAIEIASKMINDGVEILDIGGYSSRPNAENISIDEEMSRVLPIIEGIKLNFPNQLISIDTFRTRVANAAIQSGADIINDITGGYNNQSIYQLAAREKTPYIMMHMKGTPQSMQKETTYGSLIGDIISFFSNQIKLAKSSGLKDIILDPGIGFSKTIDQNFKIIKELKSLQILNHPILIGISRKSLIYKTLNIKPEESLNATTSLNSVCLLNGAKIIRVHDVKEASETIAIFKKINNL